MTKQSYEQKINLMLEQNESFINDQASGVCLLN